MDLYFLLLAALGFINLFVYIHVSSKYQMIRLPTRKSEEDIEEVFEDDEVS
jgi:hypothetical protein